MGIEVFVQVQNRAKKAAKEVEGIRPLVAGAGDALEADVAEAEKILDRITRLAAKIPSGFKPTRAKPPRFFMVADAEVYPALARQQLRLVRSVKGNHIVVDDKGGEHSIPKVHLVEVKA
jgi:hypothetical protein